MTTAPIPLTRRRFLETGRGDAWWVQPLVVFVILASFVVYSTWSAFQNAHYTFGPYLSPFYTPGPFGDSPHAWLGPKPGWWPGWLPFSAALIILPFPALFRFTCYYYRGSSYKAFWAAAPASGGVRFGIGVGTVLLAVNVVCLGGYTLGCHSMRHILGGFRDQFSRKPIFRVPYACSTCANRVHNRWAWVSLFTVVLSDVYIRMCSMGLWHDLRIL